MFGRTLAEYALVASVFTTEIYSQAPPPDPKPPDIVITFDHSRRTTPEEDARNREEMLDLGTSIIAPMEEQNVLRNELSFIRLHLSGDDLSLEKTLVVDVIRSEEVNAFAHYEGVGKHITFTTGIYKYLDLLIAAQVMSREFDAHNCAIAYAAYLAAIIPYNVVQDQLHQPAREVLLPEFFAGHHSDICPKVTVEQMFYFTKGEKWSEQYQALLSASIIFVTMHELAHFRNGDLDRPRFPIPGDILDLARVAAEQRAREAAADAYALRFFTENLKLPPVSALPIMFLIALRTNYPVDSGIFDDHPLTLSRINDMVTASTAVIKSKEFKKWAGERTSADAVKDSKQFQEYLDEMAR